MNKPGLLRRLTASVGRSRRIAEWEYAPEGWKTKSPGIKGWNEKSIAATQNEKWPRIRQLTLGTGPLGIALGADAPDGLNLSAHNTIISFGYVLALAAGGRRKISLLDWGGGIGQYFLYAQALLPGVEIEYHCKELPVLCEAGRQANPAAIFHESEKTALERSYDLVLSSSSFQYAEAWRELAAKLAAATQGHLFITRLPVVEKSGSFVVVQRAYNYGYNTEYLGWFLNRTEFLDELARLKMRLVREFLIDEKPSVKNAPEQCKCRGFLFTPQR